MSYQSYLASDRWLDLREVAIEAADYRCQLCNADVNLQVHHRTYETMGTEQEAMDLVVLCGKCHLRFHEDEEEYKSTKKKDWKEMKAMIEDIHAYLLEDEE